MSGGQLQDIIKKSSLQVTASGREDVTPIPGLVWQKSHMCLCGNVQEDNCQVSIHYPYKIKIITGPFHRSVPGSVIPKDITHLDPFLALYRHFGPKTPFGAYLN